MCIKLFGFTQNTIRHPWFVQNINILICFCCDECLGLYGISIHIYFCYFLLTFFSFEKNETDNIKVYPVTYLLFHPCRQEHISEACSQDWSLAESWGCLWAQSGGRETVSVYDKSTHYTRHPPVILILDEYYSVVNIHIFFYFHNFVID